MYVPGLKLLSMDISWLVIVVIGAHSLSYYWSSEKSRHQLFLNKINSSHLKLDIVDILVDIVFFKSP